MNENDLDAKRQRLASLVKGYVRAHSEFPMALGQQGVWYAYRRDPQSTPYNIFLAVQFHSPLDPDCMHRALRLLVERHPSLRTTFSDHGERLSQKVHSQLPPQFEIVDASGWSEAELRQRVEEAVQVPFDLESGPLLRLHLYRIHDQSWVSVAVSHHIVMDFWSLVIMLEEVNTSYAAMLQGKAPQLPAIESEFREYVQWQSNLDKTDLGRRCAEYWRQQLREAPTLLELPTDWERPAYFDATAGVVAIPFATQLANSLQVFSSRHQVTPFSILLAALQVLIHRYARQEDFLIGCPFAGRSQDRFSRTVGFFANVLPIRSQIPNAESFVELVQKTSDALLSAMEYQAYPLASIVRDLKPPRDPSRSPVLQIVCSFEKSHLRSESKYASFLFPEAKMESQSYGLKQTGYYIPNRTCRFDMEFIFEQTEHSLHGMIVYAAKLFKRECMDWVASNMANLLPLLLQHSHQPLSDVHWEMQLPRHAPVPFEAAPHRTQAMARAESKSNTSQPAWLATMEKHARQANANDHAAIRTHERVLSYQELWKQTAPRISGQTTDEDRCLAIVCQPRGPQAILDIMQSIRSRIAFIPIEGHPGDAALQPILSQVPTATWIKHQAASHSTENKFTDNNFTDNNSIDNNAMATSPIADEDLAYVVFTSGTTGVPKGVMIEHGAIANTLAWRAKTTPLATSDRVAMLLSHQFDAGLLIAWHTLSSGATLVWPTEEELRDHDLLVAFLERESITVLPATPGLLMGLAEHRHISRCKQLREIWSGGAAMPSSLPRLWREQLPVRIWNFYGPTEAAVEATGGDVTEHPEGTRVPIGSAIDHADVFPVSSNGAPLPPTVPGELVILGRGLARGYYHMPAETAHRFRPLEASGLRAYHTGDIGRILPDGQIDFLGRVDQQVKIRGYRIELEEIEGTLQSHPLIQDVGVLVVDRPHGQILVACVVLEPTASQTQIVPELTSWLSHRLPAYKIPNRILVIETLRRTRSGKIDRQQLHDRLSTLQLEGNASPIPRTQLEIAIAREWLRPLGIPEEQAAQMDFDLNFFELGGDSLQAALLATRLSERWKVRIPTSLLFDLLTLRQFVQRVVQLYANQLSEHFGAELIEQHLQTAHKHVEESPNARTSLAVPLSDHTRGTPLFLVHPPGGIVLCYRELAQHMPDQFVVGIRSRGLLGDEAMPETIEHMAADYVQAIRSLQPHGPYRLGGWSLGGIIAYEMARQLMAHGEQLEPLILLDTSMPESASRWVGVENTMVGSEYGIDLSLEELSRLQPEEQLPFLWNHAQQLGLIQEEAPQEVVEKTLQDLHALFHHHVRLVNEYAIEPLAIDIRLYRPKEVPFESQGDHDRGWGQMVRSVTVTVVPGHHHSMVQAPQVVELAREIQQSFTPRNSLR